MSRPRASLSRWHDLERAECRDSWSLYAAEAIGTALLLVGGLSAVVLVTSPQSPVAALGLPSWVARGVAGGLFGLTGALVTISPMGRHSGAHLNPAMTLAFLLRKRISLSHAAFYVLAQCLGAVVGAAVILLWGGIGTPVRFGATVPAPGLRPTLATALEAMATVVLVGVVFTFLAHARLRALTPWTMPVMYAVMVAVEAPWTGTSTNPARSLGPAVVTDTWTLFWVYVVGPALGAVVAVAAVALPGRHTVRPAEARIAAHPASPHHS